MIEPWKYSIWIYLLIEQCVCVEKKSCQDQRNLIPLVLPVMWSLNKQGAAHKDKRVTWIWNLRQVFKCLLFINLSIFLHFHSSWRGHYLSRDVQQKHLISAITALFDFYNFGDLLSIFPVIPFCEEYLKCFCLFLTDCLWSPPPVYAFYKIMYVWGKGQEHLLLLLSLTSIIWRDSTFSKR